MQKGFTHVENSTHTRDEYTIEYNVVSLVLNRQKCLHQQISIHMVFFHMQLSSDWFKLQVLYYVKHELDCLPEYRILYCFCIKGSTLGFQMF